MHAASLGSPESVKTILQLRGTVMLLPRPRFMTLKSSMAMDFTGIRPGSAQPLICGNPQYHRSFSLHLGGWMSLHLTGAAAALITKLIGYRNTWVSLSSAGISSV
jgi:hypothetical protein